jgi:hypothetical protein
MCALDAAVGENTENRRARFSSKKMPDPSAVWVRSDDQRYGMGRGPALVSEIKPLPILA